MTIKSRSENIELVNNERIVKHSDNEKLRAAYALNMCTISVSQIIDYNDAYILEQEYDAILNNLNLKQMPKDDALLRILSEILNTITFFRIQEIKRKQIEKKYNQRVKNAIWSAIPNMGVIVSDKPVAMAMSIATQVGIGYMNYRKEKSSAKTDKEDAEIELEITAIEQLNALKRELFTTAWRLADEYDFEDEWRITEKQIKQYNEILNDSNELRKYARMEAVANKFIAYPPFWYFYGHIANYIAEMAKNRLNNNTKKSDEEKSEYCKDKMIVKRYISLAKEHFEHFYRLCDFNILREDQLTASFALEYLDILWNDGDRDIEKMKNLVKLAERMAPTSFDIMQLCVVSYLKMGETDEAIRLLKILVNEEYNLFTNAKLLSRIYVSSFLFGKKSDFAMAEYRMLMTMIDSAYLFPMPLIKDFDAKLEDKRLQNKFLEEQKKLLQKDYRFVINEFIKAKIIEYNKIWPVPYTACKIQEGYFDYSVGSKCRRLEDVEKALEGENRVEYIAAIRDSAFRIKYLDLLNSMLKSLDELCLFRKYKSKDDLIWKIRTEIVLNRRNFQTCQEKLENGTFGIEDYRMMQEELSFRRFTEKFFDELKIVLMNQIDDIETVSSELEETAMKYLETVELDLNEFCYNHNLPEPEELRKKRNRIIEVPNDNYYFEYSILGNDIDEEVSKRQQRERMQNVVCEYASNLVIGNKSEVAVLLPNSIEFETYFKNVKFEGAGLKANVLAIIDDKTKKDYDFLLTYRRIVIVNKNSIKPMCNYDRVNYIKAGTRDELGIGWPDRYSNKNINIACLYDLIQKLYEMNDIV